MEIGKRFSLRNVFIGLYILAFVVYVLIGLKPVDATGYSVLAQLEIPAIGLSSKVASLNLEKGELKTPDNIVGSYSGSENNTLLIGHSSTVFYDLHSLKLGEEVFLNDNKYTISKYEIREKTNISMPKLLESKDVDTIVIMTCAGKDLGGGDATHRLIITAERL